MGTRPLEGNLDDYLDQIGAAKRKNEKKGKSSLALKLAIVLLLLLVAGVPPGWVLPC